MATATSHLERPRNGGAQARAPAGRELLPEIQALRALAVTTVLAYHLAPSRFPGGYVGVDVFFVISGFLITGHLLRELDRTGRVRLAAFWARRAKRLLPAALLVLAATTLAVLAVVPRVLWRQHLGEVLAATAYVENWRLAADAVDYLAAANQPSPVQHFWSLSVEEQFYLALPLLVLLSVLVARRARLAPRTVLLAVLVIVVGASLAASALVTANNPGLAYFSSATRAWQFAAGGLLAFAPRSTRAPLAVRTAAALLGLGALAVTFARFDDHTPFPGTAALVPVLATLAVIWAGTLPWRWTPSGLGAMWPVATVGRTSYAIYLWHFPLIVLVPLATGIRLRLIDMALVTAATLTLAYATTRWVEDPVRFSPHLLGPGRRPCTVGVWSLAGMVGVAALAVVPLLRASAALSDAWAVRETAWAQDVACLGAAALDGRPEHCDPTVARGLVPHPVLAPQDRSEVPGCWSGNGESALHMCSLGTQAPGGLRVLAVGDSHSHMLVPAYQEVATELGWRIDVAGHANCYLTRASTPDEARSFEEACTRWRAAVEEHLASSEPYDAVLVVASRTAELARADGELDRPAATIAGLRAAWTAIEARGAAVVVLADVPHPRRDVVECVVRHGERASERCGTALGPASTPADPLVSAAVEHGAPLVDLTDLMCDEQQCHAVVAGAVVWQDRGHLTATFARSLGPALAQRLTAILGPGARAVEASSP